MNLYYLNQTSKYIIFISPKQLSLSTLSHTNEGVCQFYLTQICKCILIRSFEQLIVSFDLAQTFKCILLICVRLLRISLLSHVWLGRTNYFEKNSKHFRFFFTRKNPNPEGGGSTKLFLNPKYYICVS